MTQELTILEKIRSLVISNDYRIKIHAIRHMVEEGFSEGNIAEAIENGKILENYSDEKRCLIVGSFHFKTSEGKYNETTKRVDGTTML